MTPARLAADAATLGVTLDAEQATALLAHLDMVQRWSRVYNLTALRDPAQMYSHHLLDCLAAVPALMAGAGANARVLDVGSGAGFPGAVLAIVRPDWQVSCIDAVAKKASFIRQVAAELRLPNLHALHQRVETLTGADHDLITSRAFASLADFTRLSYGALAPQGQWAAMKAKLTEAERTELPADVRLFHVEQLHVPGLDAERCLVWMRPTSNANPAQPS